MSTNTIQVVDGGAMQAASAENGGHVLSIRNYDISNWSGLTEAVTKATESIPSGDTISVTVETSLGKTEMLDITPKENSGSYYVSILPGLKTGLWDKITGGFQMTWQGATAILIALKSLISNSSLGKLGSPVTMYQASSRAAPNELTSVLYSLALLLMNLGIVNLIPVPALDGERILVNLIEIVRRRPLKQETETYVTLIGAVIVLVLMIAATWNDIMRVFF